MDVSTDITSPRFPPDRGHSSVQIAEALGLPDHKVQRIGLAAQSHDVGKVAIPDSMLYKPGPFNDEDWASMHRLTLIGERILLAAPSLARTAELVRASHERFDGAGYPDNLVGEVIPIGARIVAACDAFDAMCSQRPYSPATTMAEALVELRRCSGSQFDPRVVEALCTIAHTGAKAEFAAV